MRFRNCKSLRVTFAQVALFLLTSLISLSIEAACTGNQILSGSFHYAEPGCSENQLSTIVSRQSFCGTSYPPPTVFPPVPPPPSACVDRPMPYGYVELYQNGLVVAHTWTDSSGAFEICGNTASPEVSKNYFVRMYPSDFWSVNLTDVNSTLYSATSETYDVCTGSIRWDMVDHRTTENAAENIFKLLADDAYFALLNGVGWENNLNLQVVFPYSLTAFFPTGQLMSVELGDEQDPDVLFRTYSFFALNQLYNQTYPVSASQCGAT